MISVQLTPIKTMATRIQGFNATHRNTLQPHEHSQSDVFVPRFGHKKTQGTQPPQDGGMTESEKQMFRLSGFYPEAPPANVSAEDFHYALLRSMVLNTLTQDLEYTVPNLLHGSTHEDENTGELYMYACQWYTRQECLSSLATNLGLPKTARFDTIEEALVQLTQFLSEVLVVKGQRDRLYVDALSQKTGIPRNEVIKNQYKAASQLTGEELAEIQASLPTINSLMPKIDELKQSCTQTFSEKGIKLPGELLDRLDRQLPWF